jgi:Rrf2 family transcriptional regulator, iron-sulfur cluster assembly transcription factor
MLSTSCKYAIRAAVYIMSQSRKHFRPGIKEIAEEIESNEHTTAKILQVLVKEGLVSSAKGPNGGFFVQPDSKPVYLIDIVRVIDGDHFFFECGLGLKECSESKPCPIHHSYKGAREQLFNQFSTLTVQELSENITLGKAFLRR